MIYLGYTGDRKVLDEFFREYHLKWVSEFHFKYSGYEVAI